MVVTQTVTENGKEIPNRDVKHSKETKADIQSGRVQILASDRDFGNVEEVAGGWSAGGQHGLPYTVGDLLEVV